MQTERIVNKPGHWSDLANMIQQWGGASHSDRKQHRCFCIRHLTSIGYLPIHNDLFLNKSLAATVCHFYRENDVWCVTV